MTVSLAINTSGRIKKMKKSPDVTFKDLDLLEKDKFTKRICLSLVTRLADVIGVAAPFLLNFHLNFRF